MQSESHHLIYTHKNICYFNDLKVGAGQRREEGHNQNNSKRKRQLFWFLNSYASLLLTLGYVSLCHS